LQPRIPRIFACSSRMNGARDARCDSSAPWRCVPTLRGRTIVTRQGRGMVRGRPESTPPPGCSRMTSHGESAHQFRVRLMLGPRGANPAKSHPRIPTAGVVGVPGLIWTRDACCITGGWANTGAPSTHKRASTKYRRWVMGGGRNGDAPGAHQRGAAIRRIKAFGDECRRRLLLFGVPNSTAQCQ
jgi:hypothetical protein